jgi:phytoene dehydrogenase-like protein
VITISSFFEETHLTAGHHVCLLFTQYAPYQLAGGRAWDEQTKEDYANVVFDSIEKYAPGFK